MTLEEYKEYLKVLVDKRFAFISNVAKRDKQKKLTKRLTTKRFTKTKKP